MSKVFIVSTHMCDFNRSDRVFGCNQDYQRPIPDDKWNDCFGRFSDILAGYHYFIELPACGDTRVYAIHDLPVGNDSHRLEWIEALRSFFVREEDVDIYYLLHDLDLRPKGRPHFYSMENSFEEEERHHHVFGFHHGPDDIIGRRICSHYDTSDSFSHEMDGVLKVVFLHEIIRNCISERTFPDARVAPLFQEFNYNSQNWENQFSDPSSRQYIKHLHTIRRSLLAPYLR